MIPPEPDTGDCSNFSMKFKFPDGLQVHRKFSSSSTVKVVIHSKLEKVEVKDEGGGGGSALREQILS